MTVHRRHTTMDFGATPEGGNSKDAAPTAAVAVAATEHRQRSPDHNSYPDGKQKKEEISYTIPYCVFIYKKKLVTIVIRIVHKKTRLK
jgi:hypothetical protein